MAVALVLVVVVVVVVIAVAAGGGSAPESRAATSTAKVQRTDLIVTETFTGQLGFGDPQPVAARTSGVVTSVSAAGAVVQPGQALFAIALDPTVVVTGAVPAYRSMSTSSGGGPDVAQLEKFLVGAGYGADLTVDESFTSATAAAVKDWETALGRPHPDGAVELGEVVFASGALRVSQVTTGPGSQVQSGAAVVSATPTTKVVTVDVGADATNGLEAGRVAQLSLPNGKGTTGVVANVGTQAESKPGDPNAKPTVPVLIALDDPAAADGVDTGSVEVKLERSRKQGVLAVPVTALLALAEGGYAVQVVDSGQPRGYRLVAVEPGTFTDRLVEVSGGGIADGLEVVVPA